MWAGERGKVMLIPEYKPACYVLCEVGEPDHFVVLEYWCSGEERWDFTYWIDEASRFTFEAAVQRATMGDLWSAFGIGDLELVYVPYFIPEQLSLFGDREAS